jgi:hypothetical protein
LLVVVLVVVVLVVLHLSEADSLELSWCWAVSFAVGARVRRCVFVIRWPLDAPPLVDEPKLRAELP